MKKALLFSVVASAIGLYSCKKDGTTTTITNTIRDTTIINQFASGVANADTLTANIQVAHGASVTGEFPTSSTDAAAPVLDSLYKKTYTVIKSRYLVIYPPVSGGNIAGYYIQIAGAKSYFKVDYTQAYGWRKATTADGREEATGYVDSTIIIKLPTTINGDTFYVKYAAYDEQNRVSKAITATALVLPEADDAFTNKATGSWQYYSTNYYEGGNWRYDDYQVDTGGTSSAKYTCNNDELVYSTTGELDVITQATTRWRKFTIGKYSFSEQNYYRSRSLDPYNSTCTDYTYSLYENNDENSYGGYSYDPASKKVTFIYESNIRARSSNNSSNTDFYSATYKLVEITANYLILSETNQTSDQNDEVRYYKYIKQ